MNRWIEFEEIPQALAGKQRGLAFQEGAELGRVHPCESF